MSLRFTFLGSGTSYGVPMIGCNCPVCHSTDPRDCRLRSAGLLQSASTTLLFDIGPDLRQQALRARFNHIDAVFLTHTHADHLHGIDDLRGFTRISRQSLTLYAREQDIDYIRKTFPYIFADEKFSLGWGIPRLDLRSICGSAVEVGDLTVQPVPLRHGHGYALGYRVGSLAYLTDCSEVPEQSQEFLRDLEVLVIDGLRDCPHPTHFCFEQAIEAASEIGAARTYLTHLSHDVSHAAAAKSLPANVFLAYDGLVLEC